MFQPRNMLKCQIMFQKNTNLVIYCLEKKPMGFISRNRLLFKITFAQEGRFFRNGLLFRLSPLVFFWRSYGICYEHESQIDLRTGIYSFIYFVYVEGKIYFCFVNSIKI